MTNLPNFQAHSSKEQNQYFSLLETVLAVIFLLVGLFWFWLHFLSKDQKPSSEKHGLVFYHYIATFTVITKL